MNRLSKLGASFVNQQSLMTGLVGLWATMQLLLYYTTGGIRPAGDTGRYLGAAEVILSGRLPTSGKAMSYLAYDGFVAIILGLGWGQAGVILVQVLVSSNTIGEIFAPSAHMFHYPVLYDLLIMYRDITTECKK